MTLAWSQVVMPMGLDMNTKLETQMRIVQSDTIAFSVIKQLGLHRNKDFPPEGQSRRRATSTIWTLQQRARATQACFTGP